MTDQTKVPRSAAPNYAARRMLVSAVVITAVVSLALLGWRVISGDSDTVTAIEAKWDRVALIDRSAGQVTTVNSDGELIATVGQLGPVRSSVHSPDHIELTGFNRVTILDTAEFDGQPWQFDLAPRTDVVRLPTTSGLLLATVPTAGGNITIVDANTTTTFDVGGLADLEAPLFFADTIRTNPSGTRIAVADAGTFQTILIDTLTGEATFYPDQPIAVGDELIATSQVRGGSAEIALFDTEGTRRTTVTSALAAGGVFDGDDLVYVTVAGEVFRVASDSKEPELLGEVVLPVGGQVRSVAPALDGARLIVAGDTFQAVIDLEGATVFNTTFAAAVTTPTPAVTWRCLPVGGGSSFHSLIDLTTGEQILELTGTSVTGTATDGCTVIGERLGVGEIVSVNGIIRLPRGTEATLAPDATALVWTTAAGATELVRIDDDFALTDPIDLTDLAGTRPDVAFITG